LFNATKRLIETCRSELHTLNPKCVFFCAHNRDI
jgi:hypothetical protein